LTIAAKEHIQGYTVSAIVKYVLIVELNRDNRKAVTLYIVESIFEVSVGIEDQGNFHVKNSLF